MTAMWLAPSLYGSRSWSDNPAGSPGGYRIDPITDSSDDRQACRGGFRCGEQAVGRSATRGLSAARRQVTGPRRTLALTGAASGNVCGHQLHLPWPMTAASR